MQLFSRQRPTDHQQVLKGLEELREQLQAGLGDNLVSLIVFGDFVRPGEFNPRDSEVSLMLVLSNISTQGLDPAVHAISAAKRWMRIAVMVLTEEDLIQSCDVFPVKFVDLQEHHRLLCGRNVLADLRISGDHLRLRCEQELKNLMIRLRSLYLHRARQSEALQTSMTESIGPLLRLLKVGLTLKTGICPEESADTLIACRDEFGLNVEALQVVWDVRHQAAILKKSEIPAVFNAYMKAVHDAAIAIDQLDETA